MEFGRGIVAFASLGGWISVYMISYTLFFVDQIEGSKWWFHGISFRIIRDDRQLPFYSDCSDAAFFLCSTTTVQILRDRVNIKPLNN